MKSTTEDLRILQIGVNYIFETQRVGKHVYGSTTRHALSLA